MERKEVRVESFLRGEGSSVEEIRTAVEIVVRSFQLGDADLHDELVQDALSKVFRNLTAGQFRGESSLRTYAQTVAKYTCLTHIRRRRHEVALDPESLRSRARWAEPEESFLWSEEHLRNLAAFASLPDDCRELFRMIFIEGLSYRDVARRLGATEGAIKLRVRRCRLAYRATLEEPSRKQGRRGPIRR